jgi:hypothetical protein
MSAQLLAGLGNVLFVAAIFTISVRLLLLWRRTREWPELLISSGFLLLGLLGFPLMLASGLDGPAMSGVHVALLAGGVGAIAVSIVLFHAFTWLVFRPNETWAALFVAANGLAGVLVAVLLTRAVAIAPGDTPPYTVHAPFSLALRLLFEVWYVWVAVEALLEWSRARKRMALGLSDPVVVNRFLLWGSMGVVLALNGGVAMILEARGLSPMTDALPALWLGLNGAVAGVLMFLTFVPPASYTAWIRRRHEAPAPS